MSGAGAWARISLMLLLATTLLDSPGRALAQQAAGAADALVLSGGGARGIAHAGAIVGLERAGFAPDFVAGTSMGAIVGALYAAGLTADDIWALFERQDWQAVFEPFGAPDGRSRRPFRPLAYLAFRTTDRRPIEGLLPDARINRQLVGALFDANMRARGDFDRLPRRYRAVGADLETGAAVTLAGGDLARAVRVSMAVPGAFAPVVWNDRVLADGGIADDIPVDIAAGADLVVGVDVIRPRRPLGRPSPLAAGLRGFRLTLINATPDTSADIMIVPELPTSWSAAAFPVDARPLLRTGRAAAERAMAARAGTSDAARPDPARAPQPAPARIGGIQVDADPRLAPIVRAAFAGVVGPYDAAAVLRAADRLYATGLFAGVWPSPVPGGAADAPVLGVRAEAVSPLRAGAAAGYELDRGLRGWLRGEWRPGNGAATLAASARHDGIETEAAVEARTTLPAIAPLAIGAGAAFTRTDIRFAPAGAPGRVDRIGGWAGVEHRLIAPDVSASLVLRADRIDAGGATAVAAGPYLRLERAHPASWPVGGPAVIEAEARSGDIEYRRARARAAPAARFGPLRAALLADLTVTGGATPVDELPALGDERLVPGLEWGQLRARARAVAGADVALPVPLGAFIRLRARGGTAAEPHDWLDTDTWVGGASIEISWHTPFGDLVAGGAAATNGDRRLLLQLGSPF